MRRRVLSLILLLLPALAAAQEPPDSTAVHGVLFYSPTCPHCREVMTQTLPPILGRYGDRLRVVSINVATSAGQQLYLAALQDLAIPRDRTGVPTLLIGGRELVGSWEIPNLLPAIVDSALASGGIDWPPVLLIRQALAAQGILDPARVAIQDAGNDTAPQAATAAEPDAEPGATEAAPAEPAVSEPAPTGSTPSEPGPSTSAAPDAAAGPEGETPSQPEAPTEPEPVAEPASASTGTPATGTPANGAATVPAAAAAPGEASDTVALDPSLADAIESDGQAELAHELTIGERLMLDPAGNGFAIAVLILMLMALGLVSRDLAGRIRIPVPPAWAIPVLAVAGMGVAAYLAAVEMTGAEAVCGPVGHCNVVQQSPYARILGVPVGLLGIVGYAAVLVAWWVGRGRAGRRVAGAREAVWWMTLVATGFSIYLTFLEPFVIGASCAWCLTSALIATLLLLAATPERRAGGEVPSGRERVGASVNR